MAMITVGIDTSRSYNKKNPPGGKVSSVFSFSEGSDEPIKPARINRQRSSIDLGCDDSSKQIERQISEPVVPKSEKQESLPKEKPVASEPADSASNASGAKTGVSETKPTDKIPSVDSNKSIPNSETKENSAEVKIQSTASSETNSVATDGGKVINDGPSKPTATEAKAPTEVPCQTNAMSASSEPKPEAPTPVTPIKSESTPAISSNIPDAPAASQDAPPAAAQGVNSIISTPATAPAPRAGRRVPPGGHCSQLW